MLYEVITGRAADHLTRHAARLLDQHRQRAPDAGALERRLLFIQKRLQTLQPLRLHSYNFV